MAQGNVNIAVNRRNSPCVLSPNCQLLFLTSLMSHPFDDAFYYGEYMPILCQGPPPPYDANVVRPRPPAIGNFIAHEHPIEDLMVQRRLIASRREQREAYEFEQRYTLFQYTENNDF